MSFFLFSASWRKSSRLAALAVGLAILAGIAAAESAADAVTSTQEAAVDNEQLEKALQSLNWDQFKAVVEAIPKLKADVDAYGPLGWQYVQANYRNYPWRKSIRKLQEPQKKRLAELIGVVREGRPIN
ncbi:MAG TPA: hypothetical protein VFF03_20130 [Rhodocyclaceae bacterium]|nr:hypothetical protein [Rhodocyclaceae bacterium]